MVDDENSSEESYAVLSQDRCPSQEEDENENEDPPPLPPPRGESLIRYCPINDNHGMNNFVMSQVNNLIFILIFGFN